MEPGIYAFKYYLINNNCKQILPELRTHTVIMVDEFNQMDYYEETMSSLNQNGQWNTQYIRRDLALS